MRILARLVQVLHAHTYTRKALHKFNLEQHLNDSATSTASGEHRTFYAHIPPLAHEVCLNEWHVPTESSSKFASSESDKLSAPPGAPKYTTGTITSTWPTNFGMVTTRTERGSFSANDTAFSRLQARGSDLIPSSPALRTSDCHSPNPQRGGARHPGADSESPNIDKNIPYSSPSRSRAASPLPQELFVPVNPFK